MTADERAAEIVAQTYGHAFRRRDLSDAIAAAIREAVAAEREACAKLAGEIAAAAAGETVGLCDPGRSYYEGADVAATGCAAAIRARGEERS